MDKSEKSSEKSIEIKELGFYILGKAWIVGVAVLCAIILAFLYTSFFVKPLYTSNTSLFIIGSNHNSNGSTSADWNNGKQVVKSAPDIISYDFCSSVADKLNSGEIDISQYTDKPSFSEFYKGITGNEKITASFIYSSLKISTNEETCVIKFSSTTSNNKLSAIISNAVSNSFKDMAEGLTGASIKATVTNSGKIPASPSNVHKGRNVILAGLIALIVSCGVLSIVYIFDDKIKTQEDIQYYLGISVLGIIPDMESEVSSK